MPQCQDRASFHGMQFLTLIFVNGRTTANIFYWFDAISWLKMKACLIVTRRRIGNASVSMLWFATTATYCAKMVDAEKSVIYFSPKVIKRAKINFLVSLSRRRYVIWKLEDVISLQCFNVISLSSSCQGLNGNWISVRADIL